MNPVKALKTLLVAALLMPALSGCNSLDDDRIPYLPVRVNFSTIGVWETYGVAGAMDHKIFIKSERLPAGYPYSSLSETGFGGVLLVSDILGGFQAYDLACPVEVRYNVRVYIDSNENVAVCPECGSTYDVFANYGTPLSGPAAQKGYALTRYYVGSTPTDYMLISH